MKITHIKAEEMLDSRNNPTLSVTVACEDGSSGTFAVPSGASTGATEALELRDGGEAHGHMTTAIKNIETEIRAALVGSDANDQAGLDAKMLELDGTPNKSRLGGNALIGVSVAACRAAAASKKVQPYEHLRSLIQMVASHEKAPFLYMNLINGGKHANTRLAFQEYMIVPETESPKEALALGLEVMRLVDERVTAEYGPEKLVIGDEGGVALDVDDVETPLRVLSDAKAALGTRGTFRFALDIAASSFFKDGAYSVGGNALTPEALADRVGALAVAYDLLSVEDPFEENDFASFARLKAKMSATKVVGDDLTTTNVERLQRAIHAESIGAVVIKPNQVGTVSETLDAMALAREHGIDCIVSHRSGETVDSFISDLAFAFGVFGQKTGAPRTKERMVKIERLIELTERRI